jgi:hypothetical protein
VVRAPFFLPLYPLFVIRFQSQKKKTDLAPIRCAVEKDELPLLSQVQRICEVSTTPFRKYRFRAIRNSNP